MSRVTPKERKRTACKACGWKDCRSAKHVHAQSRRKMDESLIPRERVHAMYISPPKRESHLSLRGVVMIN
jgi:hypothetical protein